MEVNTTFSLEEGLDMSKLLTTGAFLHINEHIDESEDNQEPGTQRLKVDFLGCEVGNFSTVIKTMISIHPFVHKKILEEGRGLPLKEPCTVFVAYSGYLDNAEDPFDVRGLRNPMEVNLTMTDSEDHGLIPGLDIAIKSMLIGERSLFIFAHDVAYGEHGIPPRVPPKAQCAFYITLINKSSKNKEIKLSEPNMFARVKKEVAHMYSDGNLLFIANEFRIAANRFKEAARVLHTCRLADESEQKKQGKLLIKMYLNLAMCYNRAKLPRDAISACKELNLLKSLWNSAKALFQNAIALRMIGQYDEAEVRLKKAMELCSDSHREELAAEMQLLLKTKESWNRNQQRLLRIKMDENHMTTQASDVFKNELNTLVKNFKENDNLYVLVLPLDLNSSEVKYLREVCVRENLIMRSVDIPLETEAGKHSLKSSFEIDKEDYQ